MPLPVVSTQAPVQLHQIEDEVNDLGIQIDNLGRAGTDFAIRIHRSTDRLIAAVEELRCEASRPAPQLPSDFWNRTACAITSLTRIRNAAQAALSDDL